jgi:N-acyl homoserine lactone hydrolase
MASRGVASLDRQRDRMRPHYDIIVHGNNLALKDGFLGLANLTLVFCEGGPLLFDVGHYTNRPALLAGLARHRLEPADVPLVFLSHLHFDHALNIDLFPHARVFVSRREWDYVAAPHPDDLFVPWGIREQLSKHDLELIEGERRLAPGVTALPAPGHTPGLYALVLDMADRGRVVLASDAIKYAKEAVTQRCDMAFDTVEAGTATIRRILGTADRVVPGHFPELVACDGTWTWDQAAELPLRVR